MCILRDSRPMILTLITYIKVIILSSIQEVLTSFVYFAFVYFPARKQLPSAHRRAKWGERGALGIVYTGYSQKIRPKFREIFLTPKG